MGWDNAAARGRGVGKGIILLLGEGGKGDNAASGGSVRRCCCHWSRGGKGFCTVLFV